MVMLKGEPFYEMTEEGMSVRLYRPRLSDGETLPTRVVARDLPSGRLDFGRRILLSGPVRCERRFRNPGRQADGELAFLIPEVRLARGQTRMESSDESVGFESFAYQWTRATIDSRFKKYSGLHALVTAVWTGREEGLPENLLALYRDVGLLPVLALSGQHVLILTALATIFLIGIAKVFFRARFRAPVDWVGSATPWLPLISTMVLYFTSAGVPSMRRTAGMVVAVSLLRARGIYSSKIQTCLSTLGLMLLWNPHEMLSVGFLLSGIFTAFTIALAFDGGLRRLLFSSLVLPLLGFPVTAFFFAKVAWLTIPAQLTLGLIWELGWIPLAFLLPLVGVILPEAMCEFLFSGLESLWVRFVALQLEWQASLSQTATVAPRPTWLELGLLETVLLFGILRWAASGRE